MFVVGSDPRHPVKQTKGLEEFVWYPVVHEKDHGGNQETGIPRHFPAIDGFPLIIAIDECSVKREWEVFAARLPRQDTLKDDGGYRPCRVQRSGLPTQGQGRSQS